MSFGSLPIVTAHHAGSGAKLTASLYGGQILSYIHKGQEALFLSTRAILDGSKPIRGGIPIAFPQFAAQGPLPMHGFARTSQWEVLGSGDGFLELTLASSPDTLAQWPHAFHLTLRADFDGPTLRTTLGIANSGTSPFTFEALQHTYLNGGEGCIVDEGEGQQHQGTLTVAGLAGMAFFAKATGEDGVESRGEFRPSGEFDRVYRAPPGGGEVVIKGVKGPAFHQVTLGRSGAITHTQQASRVGGVDVVVWNPGAAKAATIADLGPEDWRSYLCVEPGRVSQSTKEDGVLQAGEVFTLVQTLTLA